MQTKVQALLRYISEKRTYCIGALVVAAVLAAGIPLSFRAGAYEPANHSGWILCVDGVAVAGAENEGELEQAYEALLTSFETEDTTQVEALNVVTIEAGNYCDSLPHDEAVAAAVAEAVDVRTVETCCHTEVISLNTEIVYNDDMYEGDIASLPGHSGLQSVSTTTVKINGETYLVRDELPVVEVEAVAPVLTMGTKERPAYVWPAHGRFTGNFGIDTINGANREHKGIDIASATGTNIYAARAGQVVYAGWNNGGYGNLVIIEHDNGTQTYYAHNSNILVSEGDVVAQGQHIAEMGATGRVTGPHCHFELRAGEYTGLYSGTPIDPMKYLDFNDL